MRDYYGNYVRVTYSQSGSTETWSISDSTGRNHKILFALDDQTRAGGDAFGGAASMPNGDELGDLRRIVTRVDVAAFGGKTRLLRLRISDPGSHPR